MVNKEVYKHNDVQRLQLSDHCAAAARNNNSLCDWTQAQTQRFFNRRSKVGYWNCGNIV